ncbi:hypothetical protein [Caulobacter mirabilis]|uniref:Lipoprotein n=1 Tax=Caulobacter mirabilis TaxID=69666 RepID=A0A2D2B410_9CAUL|nr:hypothetical protein [Caulobacter mirabilis]ATQ44987.1 hypothetical protein CSW64_11895 [Caulobacter mirabilis]
MRALSAIAATLVLAACATTESGVDSYGLGRGLVTYDAMVRAKADCAAVGGEVRPRAAGGDPAQLSNYVCYIPKKAAKP